jgi:hypothetical protein
MFAGVSVAVPAGLGRQSSSAWHGSPATLGVFSRQITSGQFIGTLLRIWAALHPFRHVATTELGHDPVQSLHQIGVFHHHVTTPSTQVVRPKQS